MKRFLPLLALGIILGREAAYAQAKPQESTRRKDQVLDLLAPYLQADTFQGTLDLTATSVEAGREVLIFHVQTQTAYRSDDDGNTQREATRAVVNYKIGSRPVTYTYKVVDTGKSRTAAVIEKKLYAPAAREPRSPALALLLPAIINVSRLVEQDAKASFSVSDGVQDGHAVSILLSQGQTADFKLRAVSDAHSHALESLRIQNNAHVVTVRISNQKFDEPLAESLFGWKPPSDYRRTTQRELERWLLPPALSAPRVPTAPKVVPAASFRTGESGAALSLF